MGIFEGGSSITIDKILRRMERAVVDGALTWLQPPYSREVYEANRYVYEATENFPDKILGFDWVDPNLGVEKAKDMVKRCIYDCWFFGVKLNGAQTIVWVENLTFHLLRMLID